MTTLISNLKGCQYIWMESRLWHSIFFSYFKIRTHHNSSHTSVWNVSDTNTYTKGVDTDVTRSYTVEWNTRSTHMADTQETHSGHASHVSMRPMTPRTLEVTVLNQRQTLLTSQQFKLCDAIKIQKRRCETQFILIFVT